ncbi:MAG TPA: cell envelope biogenesis protein LolA [Arcobacter sp.]|nr:cell envelope biogenesis protein LolA [Arcobacter sp.]
MKVLSILLFTFSIIYSDIINLKSYSSMFTQTITNSSNSKIIYNGNLYIDNNSNILWRYTKPIRKDVYINDLNVMIVEPELEQVITSKISEELNLFNILNSSKKIDNQTYQNKVNNIKYTIIVKNKILTTIKYTDEIDNKVNISFTNTSNDIQLDESLFTFDIPKYYDIIRK